MVTGSPPASAAAAVARTGQQIFDLTWREDYQPGTGGGWDYLSASQVNLQRPYTDGGTTNYFDMRFYAQASAVPEPSAVSLMTLGAGGGLFLAGRFRRNRPRRSEPGSVVEDT